MTSVICYYYIFISKSKVNKDILIEMKIEGTFIQAQKCVHLYTKSLRSEGIDVIDISIIRTSTL